MSPQVDVGAADARKNGRFADDERQPFPAETGRTHACERIAVSGASGLIGSRLVSWLRQRGYDVLPLVRRQSTEHGNEIPWNPQTGELQPAKLEGMNVVIHLAGKPLDEDRWTPKIKEAIVASRVDGTALISRTLAHLERPPRLLITASATDFYATVASPVDEASGRPGTGFVAEMCRAWEAAAFAAHEAGIRVVHIRIPSVLAGGGHSMLAAFLPLFKVGLGPILGNGKQLMCFIALDDLVRAVEFIMEREDLAGPVNVVAPKPVTNAEFARSLAAVLGRPTFLRVPGWLLRLAMGEVADAILEGDADLRPAKLAEAGFQFLYPDITSAIKHELGLSRGQHTQSLT